MSLEQYQRDVNQLDKEIVSLEKKIADKNKKAADAERKASNIRISKNASSSMVRSKQNQKQRYLDEACKAKSESAKLMSQLNQKRKKRNDKAIKLQKEEAKEHKKREAFETGLTQSYERQIESLKQQLSQSLSSQSKELSSQNSLPEYDVFISHAWEDKEDFVDEFVSELRRRNIKVWYDTSEIIWGDSMRKRIDDGLRRSRFGVVILSPNYIAERKYWTKAELDGLFQLESIGGKMILPIWHNLTKSQVLEYSPIIASRLAISTAMMTASDIAEELVGLLKAEEA